MKKTALISLSTLLFSGWALAAAQQPPAIAPERIDSMVMQVLKQQSPQEANQSDGATIRREITRQLQSFEILKNEAIKIGLDKDPAIKTQLENVEAQFYAGQYAAYLERQVNIDESEIRAFYQDQTRMIRLEQVAFDSPEAAQEALSLLLKGLSFPELMKRYPNPEQAGMDMLISLQQLPLELAEKLANLKRGEITRDPVAFNGKYYLFKLAAEARNPDAPPYAQIKDQLIQQAKQQKVQEQINKLLEQYGLHID